MPEMNKRSVGRRIDEISIQIKGCIDICREFLLGKEGVSYDMVISKGEDIHKSLKEMEDHECHKHCLSRLKPLIDSSMVAMDHIRMVKMAEFDRKRGVDPKKSRCRFFTSPKFWLKNK